MKPISRRTFLRANVLPASMGLFAKTGLLNSFALQQTPTPATASYPPVSVFNTEARTLTSSSIGQEYEISVWLPPSYKTSNSTYPVIYVLDSIVTFGLASSLAIPMTLLQEIPEAIIVGIGTHVTSYVDWINQRNRDMTPSVESDTPGSGGAAKFLSFIETELIPFINSNYRVDSTHQILFGDSLGGTFVLYTLLQKPGLFQGLIAASPSIDPDGVILPQLEQDYSASHTALPALLYVSVGSLEGPPNTVTMTFVDTLKSRSYQHFHMTFEVLENETHSTALPRAYVNGLKTVI